MQPALRLLRQRGQGLRDRLVALEAQVIIRVVQASFKLSGHIEQGLGHGGDRLDLCCRRVRVRHPEHRRWA